MRILTWNLDHGFRGKPLFDVQAELIDAARADIAVLTELPVEWSTASADGRVVSPARRPSERGQESWVAIDLICGPASRAATELRRIDPVVEGMLLSDHAAYVVDL